jgi:2-polyprenyl-6-methoxyphenol hydroxylase-like FAD-dependent oxidoreductase
MKVAIVGAGPAGSALGILLVRQGADVRTTTAADGPRARLTPNARWLTTSSGQ